ncbi:GrpE protein-like protein [Yarrowia sp. E02]|nr:GrpE protein-like protein [Yarrowia sp. E02]
MISRIARVQRSAAVRSVVRSNIRPATVPMAMINMRSRFYSDKAEKKPEETEAAPEAASEAAETKPAPTAEEFEALLAKFEKKDKECAQFKEHYQRSITDFRHLQETTKREIKKAHDFALAKFAKDLLDSVDNFDRALGVVPEEVKNDRENNKELMNFYDGIKMTQDIFEKTLGKHGMQKLQPVGEVFDPNMHEAVFEAPQPDKEAGTVFFVQQTGFTLNDRVLRAAKVGVVKGE